MSKLKARGLTSMLLAGSFTAGSISGIALYLKPKGRVANWTGWTLGGLDKSQWEAVHTNACILLLLVAAVHLFLNWKTFASYLKRRTGGIHLKREMAVSTLLLVIVLVGTVIEVPPFSSTMEFGDQLKKQWEQSAASSAPTPHAEDFSIERFARSIELETTELVQILEKEGLAFPNTQATIADVAQRNGMTPAELYTAITKHDSQAIRRAAEKSATQPASP
jgi:hypothetical protein